MRSPTYFALVLGTVGLLLVGREVGAQSGGQGHEATSLCAELIRPNGYNCDEYEAVTDDKFILGIQNIPFAGGHPVLLQHGLTAGGDTWVANNRTESLAFILADNGFDVWITNTRAIQWSHGHETLKPADSAYWNWTYDELATYDLKTSTKFVYESTGKKLSYIGHSLGTTILVAGLTNGRFNTTVRGYLNSAVLLAPILLSSHLTAIALKALITLEASPVVYKADSQEFSSYLTSQAVCGPPLVNTDPSGCFALFTASLGISSFTNKSRLGFYSQYFPQSTSTYNLNHLGQGFLRANFAFHDRGETYNRAAYGQDTAPDYNIASFPDDLPTQYWTGGIDEVADPTDAAAILNLLPKSNREVHKLSNYGHSDFVLGTNAFIDVYPKLVYFLKYGLTNHV